MSLNQIVPDTSGFTASNGFAARFVEPFTDVGPALMVDGTRLVPHQVNCLREFFRHEEDERLARWRWPENPDYVVYPLGRDLDGLRYAQAMYEPTGNAGRWQEGQKSIPEPTQSQHLGILAVAAFFDAHPEPKPWEKAKPGEVWELTIEGRQRFAQAGRGDFRHLFEFSDDESMSKVHTAITAGRKCWPEDAS